MARTALERLAVRTSLEQVSALLLAVAERLDGGFSRDDVEEFCTGVSRLDVGDDLVAEPAVSFRRTMYAFVIDVSRREGAVFEIAFIAAGVLIDMVEREARESLEDVRIRRMRVGGSVER